jgi:hypothetical protein
VLAIGVWSDVGSPGLARVYEWDGSSWVQRGGDIDGEANGCQDFGYAIAMSGDGSVLAIGDPRNNNKMGFEAGFVRVIPGTVPRTPRGAKISREYQTT